MNVFICHFDFLVSECDFGFEFVAPNGESICILEHKSELALVYDSDVFEVFGHLMCGRDA